MTPETAAAEPAVTPADTAPGEPVAVNPVVDDALEVTELPPITEVTTERKTKIPAALARQQRQLREEREQLKRDQEMLALERKANAAAIEKAGRFDNYEKALSTDKLKFLQDLGIDLNEVNRLFLESKTNKTPEELVAAQVAKAKEEIQSDLSKRQTEAAAAQVKQQLDLEKSKLSRLAGGDKERWDLVNADLEANVAAVWQFLEDNYKELGDIDFSALLDAREKILQDKEEARFKNSKKLQEMYKKHATPADKAIKNVVKAKTDALKTVPKEVAAVPEKRTTLSVDQLRANLLRKHARH